MKKEKEIEELKRKILKVEYKGWIDDMVPFRYVNEFIEEAKAQREKDFDDVEQILKDKALEYESLEQLQEAHWILQTLNWLREEIKKLKEKGE